MSNTDTCGWPGRSTKTYNYYVFAIGEYFMEQGGNYIFCRTDVEGRWVPLYIGQTSNLNERLSNHEKEECARSHGATHIHAHLNDLENARLTEEKDLIDRFSPICNG